MSTADDRRATDRDAIEPFSTCAYISIYRTPSKRSHDAISTRRKELHPLSFGWGYATVSLHTKKIKGLHENDFIMAAKLDHVAAEGVQLTA